MLHWKKWHFFGLIFKLKSLSLPGTISIWSNISMTLAVKMHISSRYNSKVTNCWSPKHISISWQKLDPKFDNPDGIFVNSYNPDNQAQMLSYEYLPHLLAFVKSLVPSEIVKTIGSGAQPAMPHLYGVKGRHPLPQ